MDSGDDFSSVTIRILGKRHIALRMYKEHLHNTSAMVLGFRLNFVDLDEQLAGICIHTAYVLLQSKVSLRPQQNLENTT